MTPAVFRAAYSDWKLIRSRGVVQLVFEIPLEASRQAYDCLGGMPNPGAETWVAIARLAKHGGAGTETTTQPKQGFDNAPASQVALDGRARKPVNRLTLQAVKCCRDPVFQAFLYEHDMAMEKSDDCAKTAVYLICSVQSRKDIVPGTPAALAWDELMSKFMAWKVAA